MIPNIKLESVSQILEKISEVDFCNRHSTESDDGLPCSGLNTRSECTIYLAEIVVSAALDSLNATLKCILCCLT